VLLLRISEKIRRGEPGVRVKNGMVTLSVMLSPMKKKGRIALCKFTDYK